MTHENEKSWLLKHPLKSMIVSAIVLAVLGIILTFTVVGSIIGLPLLGISILLALAAWLKNRNISPGAHTHSS